MRRGLSRRGLLKAGAALGGGLCIGVVLPSSARAAPAPAPFTPNAWLTISKAGLSFFCSRVEMGQGTWTSLATLMAEELEVEPTAFTIAHAPPDAAFANPDLGLQLTGGSTSVKHLWEPLRRAGATARELLVAAAARQWKVPPSECVARNGEVHHEKTGAKVTYGDLAELAAALPVPSSPKLKTKGFRLIGTSVPRLDAAAKTDGSAVYGLDVQVPGALTAAIVRCPVPGGTPKSFDAKAARAKPGVVDVIETPNGVAVLATGTWFAREAARVLEVTWSEGPNAAVSSAAISADFAKAATEKGTRVRSAGGPEKALAGAKKRLTATYELPFVAHATMEPLNATAWVTADRCEIWAGNQAPGMAQEIAHRITGLSAKQIVVHTPMLGGGFGRRGGLDFIAEAVFLSNKAGKPVKVVWSREDDLRHDIYRPAALHAMEAGLSEKGELSAWHHTVVTQSLIARFGNDLIVNLLPFGMPNFIKNGAASAASGFMAGSDQTSHEGASTIPYDIPNLAVDYVRREPGVPGGFWRSVGSSHTAFAVECFLDEVAAATGKDPLELRRTLLARKHRHKGVLELAAQKAGWDKPPPPGVFRGLAQHACFDSYAAAVAEVSVVDGVIRVQRLVMAVDCGQVVNPDGVRMQLESAAIFALSATLKHQITLDQGRVQQSNFHDFELVRMYEAPRIEAHFVVNQAQPTGVGELGVPVVAPAVANAVFAATGKRLRSLPLKLQTS